MQAKVRKALFAVAAVGATACLPGAATAGPDDVNPVFAAIAELPRATLDRANGRGIDEDGALQSAVVTIQGAGLEPTQEGENGAAMQLILPAINCGNCSNNLGSAFSGASALAAITQNNGSNNAINNLLLVDVQMHQ